MSDKKKLPSLRWPLIIGGVIVAAFLAARFAPYAEVEPDWAQIAAWPDQEAGEVEAQPDPNRIYTAIVLDDSGSMSGDMPAARSAVLSALNVMAPEDRVAVVALNDGVVMEFTTVSDAQKILPDLLQRVTAAGSTPLTAALASARRLLAAEAANVGGFGTYRMLVTTDGEANDNDALLAEVEDLARVTPIQIATIGVGISGRHPLNRDDLGSFVAIGGVAGLADALQSAVAEQTSFAAITDFGGN